MRTRIGIGLVMSAALLLAAVPARPEDKSVCPDCEDHLEPAGGVFMGAFHSVWYAGLSELLLGAGDNHECQFVFLPSFKPEHAVFIFKKYRVIAKGMKEQLWDGLRKVVRDGALEPGIDPWERMRTAFKKANKETVRWERDLDPHLHVLLAEVCGLMLDQQGPMNRKHLDLDGTVIRVDLDGTVIHVKSGVRAGVIHSQPEGRKVAEFVNLGEALERYARNEIGPEELKQQAEKLRELIKKEAP
jgi:hypothetical protein